MAVDRAAVIARVPALKDVGDAAEWSAALADAKLQVNEAAWGDLYELGVIYLAAHLLECAHPDVARGGQVVSSESIGSISRSYAVTAPPSTGVLGSTPPGREFLRLRRSLGLGFSVV